MEILIYIFILGSIMLVAFYFALRNIVRLSPDLKIDTKAGTGQKEIATKAPLIFSRIFLPLNRLILSKTGKLRLTGKLSLAEMNLLPEDFLAIKEILILAFLFIVFFTQKRMEPLWLVMIIFAGFVLPDFYLNIKIKKRRNLVVKVLPDIIDLLSLCVGGGLDFMQGLDWVIKRSKPSPLIKELSLTLHEIRVGAARIDALKNMGKRLNTPEVFSLINTLVSADRMGTPIFDVLSDLAEEARRQRFQRGERLALTAPIKMLFPLVFFILPVVGIIVGGPILIQFLQGGIGLGKF
jgi:tight adherence protein C